MRPKRNVVSKYQRDQEENDVQRVSFVTKASADHNPLTRPLRRALADKTNSGSGDNITSVFKMPENKKPRIVECSGRPKRQARLPARLSDRSMEIPPRLRNLGMLSSTSTPLKLNTKGTKTGKKMPVKEVESFNKGNEADPNNNPDCIPNPTKALADRSISPVKKNNYRASITPDIYNIPTIPIIKKLPLVETKSRFKEPVAKPSEQFVNAGIDVYEFDFDPSEEPVIKKKKKPVRQRKKIVKEKLASAFFVKENYSKKVDKKMEELKRIIASKTVSKVAVPQSPIPVKPYANKPESNTKAPVVHSDVHIQEHSIAENVASRPHSPEFIRDFQFDDNDVHCAAESTAAFSNHDQMNNSEPGLMKSTHLASHANPIVTYSNTSNRSDLSFLGEMPVACSSFNVSEVKKRPSGSPWRANFEIEPKRWPVNFYLKPGSLTPAYESTFHSVDLISNQSKVYAPLLKPSDTADQATLRTPEKDYSLLKQSSILSFFEEVMTKSATKKVRKSKLTPQKFDLFYDASESSNKDLVTKRKAVVKSIFTTPTKLNTSSDSRSQENSAILSGSPQERTVLGEIASLSSSPNKTPTTPSPKKNHNKENIETSAEKRKNEFKDRCFGFDDSDEENDQENVSPQTINVNRRRGAAFNIGSRKREVLKELNIQRGPMRVNVPLKPKLVLTENIPEKILDLMSQLDAVKSQGKPPKPLVIDESLSGSTEEMQVEEPEVQLNAVKAQKKSSKPVVINESTSNSSEEMLVRECELQPSTSEIEDLPLFTDINFVHYDKPERRSYGKPKAAAAKRIRSTSKDHEDAGSDLDLSAEFTINQTKKKSTKKRKVNAMSKKEEKEADEWVAGFNSMVEEVDEYSLVVE